MWLTRYLVLFSFVLSLKAGLSLAHEGARHEQGQTSPSLTDASLLTAVNAEYLAAIKPIFKRACYDCHSTQTRYPWYYDVPGVKQWMDSDIREAMKHMDMTNDFPFRGHGSPQKDFEAIRKVVQDNSMPPFRYKMMHWDAVMTDVEKEVVLKWVDENQKKMQN